jgi:hypothetical protein
VIVDTLQTKRPVDGLLPLVWSWKEDKEEGEAAQRAGELFDSTRKAVLIGEGNTE